MHQGDSFPTLLAADAPGGPVLPHAESVSAAWAELQHLATAYGLRVLGAAVFVVVAWTAAGWCSKLAGRALKRTHLDLTLSKFFATSIRWVILALSGIACLNIFGIETTSFAAVIGAAGLAIGLAFQGTLANLAAGAMLLIFRPFRVGDAVVIAGQTGVVDGIELFTTKLDTADNRRIIIPNSSIAGAIIENQSHHATRRVTIPITVSYDAEVETVRRALADAVRSVPHQLPESPPEVAMLRLGPLGMDWEARTWTSTDKVGAVQEASAIAVKEALDRARVTIVVPPYARIREDK